MDDSSPITRTAGILLSPTGGAHLQRARRELGSVYTPQATARQMARACLDRWHQTANTESADEEPTACRLLDPACGDGVFLLEVFDELCRRRGAESVTSGKRDRTAAAFRL